LRCHHHRSIKPDGPSPVAKLPSSDISVLLRLLLLLLLLLPSVSTWSLTDTMKTASVLAASIALVSAKTIEIKAGPGGLVFSPNSTTAEKGDVLEFHFYPRNHSVAQGFYSNPCQPVQSGGFFSGYVPSQDGASPTIFSVIVNDTSPIWYYCTQARHCQDGMVGVINPPQNETLEDYKKAAESFNGTTGVPDFVYGGAISHISGSSTTTGATTTEAGTASHTSAGEAATTKPENAGPTLQPLVGSILGVLGIVAMGLLW
jgi:plastocyanin